MISLEKINNLSEDELALLLYALNHIKPPKPINEVSYGLIKFYRPERLKHILEHNVRPHVNASGILILDSVIQKLMN